ncbi:MAG: AraC family transcriptional regulator [Saccharofermentanales bacterium]
MDQTGLNEINPYVIYSGFMNQETCPPCGTHFEKRIVKWYELEFVLWGTGYITTNGKRLSADKGNLFFRKPGMTVQGVSPYYCYLIIFDLFYDSNKAGLYSEHEYFNSNADNRTLPSVPHDTDIEYALPDVMDVQQYTKYEVLFNLTYIQYIKENQENQFFLKAYLMQILALAYTEWLSNRMSYHSSNAMRSNYFKVQNTKKYIDTRLCNHFSLGELAGIAGLSPNFLCKIFRDILGYNIFEYINSSKINMAKTLLLNTNKAVKEISIECGFQNEPYFYTLFKKTEGICPSAYRERYKLMSNISQEEL